MNRNAIIYIMIQASALAFLFFFAIGITSCKTQQPPAQTIEKERIVEIHTRDTSIITQPDSASMQALLHCDSAYNVVIDELTTLQGERIKAASSAKQTGGGLILKLDCKEDSLINEIQLRDSIISNFEKQTVVVKEQYVPAYYKRVSTGFWILLVMLVLIVGWKVAKIYFKIQSGGIL